MFSAGAENDRKKWLTQSFMAFDSSTKPFQNEGCSVIAAYINHDERMLYIANAGNARCIIGRNGRIVSSKDHIPQEPKEFDRISIAGKTVFGGRIMGDISNSRGFGDHRYKDSTHLSQSE